MSTAPACAAGCKRPSPSAVICTECTRELAQALVQAASISGDLDDAVARLMKRGGGGRASSEVPLMFDPAASLAADDVRMVLVRWERALDPVTWPLPTEIARAARWLLARLNDLRQHERAGEAHRGILAAVHRATAVVDRLPERAPAGTCADCGAQLLAELGADSVTCACGLRVDGIAEQRARRAAAADVLGTATEISDALATLGIKVDASKIRAWKTRGRLTARPGGFVALSDVLDLHAKQPKVRG